MHRLESLRHLNRLEGLSDLPRPSEKLRALPPFEFENWAVIALGGVPNTVQVGDMGIDGKIFPVGTKPSCFGDRLFNSPNAVRTPASAG